jgi:hypothetical protein
MRTETLPSSNKQFTESSETVEGAVFDERDRVLGKISKGLKVKKYSNFSQQTIFERQAH